MKTELENKYNVDIMVCSKDRVTECTLLLESLRKQSFKNFSIYILDDGSGTPMWNFHFFVNLTNLMRLEGTYVKVLRNEQSHGVCDARNLLIKEVNMSGKGNMCLRLDDDVVLEKDYIEKLLMVIEQGYDMASGIVPNLGMPEFKREIKFVKPVINKITFDDTGNITYFGDDCGYSYLEEEILPAHHFRTNCLYKKEIQKKITYERGLSVVGFREESFFSLRALWLGYKIGIHTGAKAFHYRTPSGGCRHPNYQHIIQSDDNLFKIWVRNSYARWGSPLK